MRSHSWKEGQIFVFGSNLDGIHGAGAALFARMHCGAILGQGEGLQGQSYGLPTCRHIGKPLRIDEVEYFIRRFLSFADQHPELEFFVTAIGTGIAGFRHAEIAKAFVSIPSNCILPPEWDGITGDDVLKKIGWGI